MTIKVLFCDAPEPICCSLEQFQSIMGNIFLRHLQFEDSEIQDAVLRRCARLLRQGKLEPRQKWLGSYYSQEIRSGFIPDVTIAWIDETIGYGVVTNRDYPRGAYLGEYTGLVRKQRFWKKIKNDYCFEYTFISGKGDSPYLIDAKGHGNHTRFINHGTKPNLETASVCCEGSMHIILYAIQDISKGTQLCYDYGDDYWKKRGEPLVLS